LLTNADSGFGFSLPLNQISVTPVFVFGAGAEIKVSAWEEDGSGSPPHVPYVFAWSAPKHPATVAAQYASSSGKHPQLTPAPTARIRRRASGGFFASWQSGQEARRKHQERYGCCPPPFRPGIVGAAPPPLTARVSYDFPPRRDLSRSRAPARATTGVDPQPASKPHGTSVPGKSNTSPPSSPPSRPTRELRWRRFRAAHHVALEENAVKCPSEGVCPNRTLLLVRLWVVDPSFPASCTQSHQIVLSRSLPFFPFPPGLSTTQPTSRSTPTTAS